MIFKIIVELFLALVIIMAGTIFWELLKRDRFLIKTIQDDNLLSKLINKQRLNDFNASRQQSLSIENIVGYAEKIKIWEEGDAKAQIKLKIITLIFISISIAVSLKLGLSIVILNIILLLITAIVPIGNPERNNAFNHIMLIASIINEWLKNNEQECTQWIEKNMKYKKVLNALRSLS